MFEITQAQRQAAMDAMNGLTPATFLHLILFGIGVAATLWFFFIFLGLWSEVQLQKSDVGDAIGKMAIAILILICVGALIVT